MAPGCMHNSVEDLNTLNKLGVKGICNSSRKIIEVNWSPPQFQWVKVNTDGMALGAPGRAAIGVIFRNYRGFSKGAFCKFIRVHTAFEVELLAFIQAIHIAWEKGWHKLWVEMDSKSVVLCVNRNNFVPPWFAATLWQNYKWKMNRMISHISHIFMEGNQVANRLSKMGMHNHELKWWHAFPQQISSLLGNDYHSMPSYRFK